MKPSFNNKNSAEAEHALIDLKIGQLVEGEGIFLGEWYPEDNGFVKEDNKVLYLFAAPEDLSVTMTFNDAVAQVADLKNYHGHKGSKLISEKEFLQEFKNRRYRGEWIVPTHSMLEHNLYKNRDKLSLKNNFNLNADSTAYYASCSAHNLFDNAVWAIDFRYGRNASFYSCSRKMSVRLVRVREHIVTEEELTKKYRKHLELRKPIKVRKVKFD